MLLSDTVCSLGFAMLCNSGTISFKCPHALLLNYCRFVHLFNMRYRFALQPSTFCVTTCKALRHPHNLCGRALTQQMQVSSELSQRATPNRKPPSHWILWQWSWAISWKILVLIEIERWIRQVHGLARSFETTARLVSCWNSLVFNTSIPTLSSMRLVRSMQKVLSAP